MLELQVCSAGGGTQGFHMVGTITTNWVTSPVPTSLLLVLLEMEMDLVEYLVILYLGFFLLLFVCLLF